MPPKARLLVVDDSVTNRAMVCQLLEGEGYHVVAVVNGQEALSVLDNQHFDLVILDVVMPGLSGIEVLERIRTRWSKLELPVLMMTARSDSTDVVKALEAGASDYVTKPIDFAIALARIQSQLSYREQVNTMTSKMTPLKPDGSVAVGTVLDGRYELLSILGSGGYAIVYKARQVSTGQIVAVKLLRAHRAASLKTAPVELKRFEREMKLIGELRHPHMVRLIDSGWLKVASASAAMRQVQPKAKARSAGSGATLSAKLTSSQVTDAPETRTGARGTGDDTRGESPESEPRMRPEGEIETRIPFLVMEYLEGESLFHYLTRMGRLSVEQTADLMVPIIDALQEAHEQGVIHRDLKPGNIYMAKSRDGSVRPVVLDFGVAKLVKDDSMLTNTESVIGTPAYMAPEQAKGARTIDERSDQYSLGTIVYRCVTGRRPFEGEALLELAHEIALGNFKPPHEVVEGLPEAFEGIILRAMSKEPDDRYPSLRAMAHAMYAFAGESIRSRWAENYKG